MNKLQLAVISDIHVGEGARAKDLCPAGVPGRDNKPDDKYRDKFLKFLEKNNIKADYLVLPGDVTNHAEPNEVQIASDFIVDAARVLAVNDNIVFVPGNHDVDWSVLDLNDATGVRRDERYIPIRHHKFKFKAICDRGEGDLFDSAYFTIWNTPNLLVVGYNSSHHDQPKVLHHGLVAVEHLDLMRMKLKHFPINKDQVRLFLVHHHSHQYDDPIPEFVDVSIMVNAEKLQTLLNEFSFDLLVHGHRHLPRFKTQSINGLPEVAVLCSGSFSYEIDTKWSGSISNQFHLITIDGRDSEEQLITGRVESWSYNCARGWSPSNAVYDGISHVEPFGTYTRPESLKAVVGPILNAKFKTNQYIEWRWVVEQMPNLRNLRPDVVIKLLDDLSDAKQFKRIYDSPEQIILLKNI